MKHLKLLAILLCMTLPAHAMSPIKSNDITFPGNFYTDEIRSCKAVQPVVFESISIIKGNVIEDRIVKYNGKEYIVKGYTQKDQTIINDTVNIIEGLIGYDWHADHTANSNSMNVYHQAITVPMNLLMAATHNALSKNIQSEIDTAKNLLIDLAKADTLYDSIGYYEVKKKPECYAGKNDINAPCWYHEYEFARNVFSNYMITALWLKDELNEQEFKIVNKYIEKMYKKFIKPVELQKQEQGFYATANGGLSILAYASWTNNKKLAAKEINHRFKEMDRLFYEDGYINNNSFRGFKGQWYHSYGVDIALGYVYIAELWGAELPTKLQNKLVKASEVVNLAITDWDKFKSRKYIGKNSNAIIDPKNAIKHTHQFAIAIDTLMLEVTNVELEHDTTYLEKREHKIEMSYGIDELIGFPAGCIK